MTPNYILISLPLASFKMSEHIINSAIVSHLDRCNILADVLYELRKDHRETNVNVCQYAIRGQILQCVKK